MKPMFIVAIALGSLAGGKGIRQQRESGGTVARTASTADEPHDEQRAGGGDHRGAEIAQPEDQQAEADDQASTVFVSQRTDQEAGECQHERARAAEDQRHLVIGELQIEP